MISRNSKYILIFCLNLFLNFNSYGQTDKAERIKTTQSIKELNDVKVFITHYRSLMQSAQIPHCSADILIYKSGNLIDSVKFREIEAVGGHYGLLTYTDLIDNHIVISKYGDYSGETIIINSSGEKFITIGGYSFLDTSSGLLFSILDSDLSGLSVFDLRTDSEVFIIEDIEERPKEFYKNKNDKYYFLAVNDETGIESIWEIEFELERIMQMDLEKENLKSGLLKKLIDYDKININCE